MEKVFTLPTGHKGTKSELMELYAEGNLESHDVAYLWEYVFTDIYKKITEEE